MTEPVAAVEVHPRAALVVPDAEDETWAKIRFGDRTWPQVFAVARGINSPATRVVIANAARDAVRDGDLDPRLALPGLLDLVQSEPSEVVVRSLLRFAVDELCGPFTAPDERAPALAQVRLVAGRLLDDAEAGSDRQLAVFRFVIAAAADVERVVGVARPARASARPGAGHRTRPGPSCTGWRCWVADPGTIEDQLRRDPTAAGRTHAAEARAARPEPQAKDDAWRSADEPVGAERVRVVRHRARLLPALPVRTVRRLRRTLLRRDPRHRELSAPAGRWVRLPSSPTRCRTLNRRSWLGPRPV